MAFIVADSLGQWQQAAQQQRGQDAADYFNALASIRAKRALDLQEQELAFNRSMEALRAHNASVMASRGLDQQAFANRLQIQNVADARDYKMAALQEMAARTQAMRQNALDRSQLGYDQLSSLNDYRNARLANQYPLVPSLGGGASRSGGTTSAVGPLPDLPQSPSQRKIVPRADGSGYDVTTGAMPSAVPLWRPDTQRQMVWLSNQLNTELPKQLDRVNKEISFLNREVLSGEWESGGIQDELQKANNEKLQIEDRIRRFSSMPGVVPRVPNDGGPSFEIKVPYALSGEMPTKQFIPARLEDVNPSLLNQATQSVIEGAKPEDAASMIAPGNRSVVDYLKNVKANTDAKINAYKAQIESVAAQLDSFYTNKEKSLIDEQQRLKIENSLKEAGVIYIPPAAAGQKGRLIWPADLIDSGSAVPAPATATAPTNSAPNAVIGWDERSGSFYEK